ncbi:RNA-binding protein [Alkalihalobacillus alcalophilus ATCC 27647 = CGMCC 1.3604]|uniref:RNA-binding S4 protein n=1 Tax=Alkalihalobacillus alcalophilus ATCC 27647 = CGMCC 1.3604 TaxID=1218173 RepID=A0A094XBZ1_ALKAL|nr:S4 domain-containing protein YaaA [Alkalihalobacillus alcalophilus]KGA96300.1 RNA-binding S4 protein [Alkalihalobacillus alcalophilus ATCC 27647 = CGMCC 1.3604]MED1560358.1 S4 domain-containing protein YaaA [Alkalihalobacillus alcalophilus]THG89966.1 RNA-binding protein [Alkalihalobacillus alcalophilus ATCC 27647 = CGMCC 1.3604]
MEHISISTEYITLGQLLKEVGAIDTGGMAKWYLAEYEVLVNGELESRRGKKLVNGDRIQLADGAEYEITAN